MPNPCIHSLQKQLPPHQVLTDSASCIAYSYDNGRHRAMPLAVVLPENTQQVQMIVQTCANYGMPITARGRGTGTPGGAVPTPQGLVISFERMERIIQFCPESRYILVEPGVLNQNVQNLAKTQNLFWPVDPSSQAFSCVGGNLGYNAGGPHTLKYGSARDNVLYLEAVTGTGELIKTGFAVTKAASGYDLTRLIIGAEGTLALVTKACLKLSPRAEATTLLQAWFASEADACHCVETLMNQAITPAALEFMDQACLGLLRKYSQLNIPSQAASLLLIELDGLKDQLPFYVTQIKQYLPQVIEVNEAKNAQEAWIARKALSPILRSLAPHKINEDVVVPVHELHHFLTWLHDITAKANILNVNFGHAGNGNLHVNLLPQNSAELTKAENLLTSIFEKVIELGGTLSGEHGIGLDKKPFMAKAFSPSSLDLMRKIKQQFDPKNILNPDKLLP
ncbi:MAG: oxidoreductase, FAD-binding [Gammaproteobacteria bacterium]|jgi:D-lactate dehydrogenase|nr:oxidoreductase, FAD-binding [Gammaproteobacteria bacterium]